MKNKNRILIATGIYPPDIGGPATMLPPLRAGLEASGFEVRVITYSEIETIAAERGNIFRIKKGNFFSRFFYFLKLLQLSFWSDVVYVMDVYSVGYFAYLVKKITGKKYVVRFVGDSAWETAVGNGWTQDYIVDFQSKTYDDRIESLKNRRRKILVNADKVVVVSKFIGSIAGKIGVDPQKIQLIYNSVGFDGDAGVSSEKEIDVRSKLPQGAKIIITACRLTPWKGVDGIIKIMPDLNKEFKDVFLLVLGDGPELENLKKLAVDLSVAGQVIFKGRVDHNDMIGYFKAADLFVLNTNYEAMSHTLLEAMRYRLPIIATDIGGNPELIESGREGLLVDYNNIDQLLKAVRRILTEEGFAKELGAKAEDKQKLFSWENTVSGTVKLFRELTNE